VNETILQFGAGNFLRAFADLFVQEMNDAGQDVGRIVVIQSTEGQRARLLNAQHGRYHVLVRGIEDGVPVERTQTVASISRALVAHTEWAQAVEAACSPHLKAILSNTTEAGLTLDAADIDSPGEAGVAAVSFPARLLALLRARYEAGQPGVAILPCELVENNGARVRDLVLEQAHLWHWDDGKEFLTYLRDGCAWVNSLVDRIVSGKPAEHPLLADDPLLTVAEPYAFWAVEGRPQTAFLNHPAIRRVPDVQPYTLRKVRILNGAHSALVAHVRRVRPDIPLVREAIADPAIGEWLRGLLFEEIVPTIADRCPDAEAFAHQTLERFANPFLDHKLSDIALHHEKKVQVRLIPTAEEYRTKFGQTPVRLQEAIDAS
jgi:tagaturonate reductase